MIFKEDFPLLAFFNLIFLQATLCFYITSTEWNRNINSSSVVDFEISSIKQKFKSKSTNEFPTEFSFKLKELNKTFNFKILAKSNENPKRKSNIYIIDKLTDDPIKYKYEENENGDMNEVYTDYIIHLLAVKYIFGYRKHQ